VAPKCEARACLPRRISGAFDVCLEITVHENLLHFPMFRRAEEQQSVPIPKPNNSLSSERRETSGVPGEVLVYQSYLLTCIRQQPKNAGYH
jgi:hypothetical protein